MPIAEEAILFSNFAATGVTVGDTFDTWRKKTNGTIMEVSSLRSGLDSLSGSLFTGGVTPKFVTIETDQTISGTKTFGAGAVGAPKLKVGAAGLWQDAGDSSLNSTQQFKAVKIWSTGSGLHLRGINYTSPSAIPASTRSFMITDASGNMSWIAPSSVIGDTTLAVNGSNQLVLGLAVTANYTDLSVTRAKIALGAIDDTRLADNSVINAKVVDGAITNSKLANGSVDTRVLADNAVTGPKIVNRSINSDKVGGIGLPIQVSQSAFDNTLSFSGHATNWTNTFITKTIAVRSGSTVRIQVNTFVSSSAGAAYGQGVSLRVLRNGTPILLPTGASSRRAGHAYSAVSNNTQVAAVSIDLFDSPGVPSDGTVVTYLIQATTHASYTGYINRSVNDSNDSDSPRTLSTITLTEISG